MENQMNDKDLHERMRLVTQRMFALRNGVIADTLRKGGSGYKIIFGLNLPQLVEMAEDFGTDPELAEALHDNVSTRESLLLAPMLVDAEKFRFEDANRWIASSPDMEAIDILCHKLLRKLPYSVDLIATNLIPQKPALTRYAALRLCMNLLQIRKITPQEAKAFAEKEMQSRSRLTMPLAQRIVEEANESYAD